MKCSMYKRPELDIFLNELMINYNPQHFALDFLEALVPLKLI